MAVSEKISHNEQYINILELIKEQLENLQIKDLKLIYEIVCLLKPNDVYSSADTPHPIKKVDINDLFTQAQNALSNIERDLSDDIINIEREDRL